MQLDYHVDAILHLLVLTTMLSAYELQNEALSIGQWQYHLNHQVLGYTCQGICIATSINRISPLVVIRSTTIPSPIVH
jgi:hypothetical protein